MAAEKSGTSTPSKGQAWFCTTGLPSDVVVEVDDMTFHLHKFPLMSKSKKLHDLIKQQETKNIPNKSRNDDVEFQSSDNDEEPVPEEDLCHVSLSNFPGGSETFETAAKFCYGVKIDLTAEKVAPLRCAGEVLQMTEEYAEDNLISKTERFFTNTVFKSIRDSIKALKSCEKLSPMAEELGIVERCTEAIASKASLYDPSLFGWPVNDVVLESTSKESKKKKNNAKLRDAWVEDLADLSSPIFNSVISAMREKDINPEVIESCLIHYAKRCFPGITRSNRKPPSSMTVSEAEQRQLLEYIISNLPPENTSRRSQSVTRFLFGLLRIANILNASDTCKSALEKKIGAQLEQATLDDLLIPSYSYLIETLYDVDCVERILGHFLANFEEREIEEGSDGGVENVRSPAVMLVGKLIDGYLSEIASDANLKPEKFIELALSLPEKARLYDDGVYRAVDVYLKAHPWLSESDREKISGVMDCQKLTLEACTHAAQNERLPLRAVVQVLFFEQLQLRHAIAGTLRTADIAALSESAHQSVHEDEEVAGGRDTAVVAGAATTATERDKGNSSAWREAIRENQVLRLDMDSMRTRVHELERECSTMKKVIQKFDKVGGSQNWRSTITRKFGCKFKTQVCDSHESTVVESRKGRHDQKNRR